MPKYKVTVQKQLELSAPDVEAVHQYVRHVQGPNRLVTVEEIIEPFKMGDKVMVKAASLPKPRNYNGWDNSTWDRRRYVQGREFTVVGRTLADRCILQSHSGERVLYYRDDQLVRSEA